MTRMRWDCGIRRCYIEQRFDPEIFDGCLPRKASFMNIDAMVEINGRFLFIEHKSEGAAWDSGNGQLLALKALNRLPNVTVWWIRDHPEGFQVAEPGSPLEVVSLEELRARITQWGDEADGAS